MKDEQKFSSVWDALENDPIKAENMKLRSALMMAITARIEKDELNQTEAAKKLAITQPRVSVLMQGKIESFRLDTLVNIAHRLRLHVNIDITA